MKKCHICGMIRKVTINCPMCNKDICLNDFYCSYGLCADCMTIYYQEKYKDKIEAYHDEIKNIDSGASLDAV